MKSDSADNNSTPSITSASALPGRFVGLGVSPGVAIGPIHVYQRPEPRIEHRKLRADEVETETERFEWTLSRAERDLNKILALARKRLGREAAGIFDAQLLMLRDETLHREVIDRIRQDRLSAGAVLESVMARHGSRLKRSGSAYLRERSSDLKDVQDRLLYHLQRGRRISAIGPGRIVVAEVLTAADLLVLSRSGVLGCAFDLGGATSHVAILARALGIPAVVSARGIVEAAGAGSSVIVDGTGGVVVVDPGPATLQHYQNRRRTHMQPVRADRQHARFPAATLDGVAVCLRANVGLPEEVAQIAEQGASGIGLLRTEVFLLDEGTPSLNEQYQFSCYRQVVEAVHPEPSTFRLMDLGGGTVPAEAPKEWNPLPGRRGLRVLLRRPDVLMPQLRAILRAGAHGAARLLLPMVTDISELGRFREVLSEASSQLERDGLAHDADIAVGIMIEVPAAALTANRLAQHVSFFSLGTNDLTQFTLAVDRASSLPETPCSEVHPAVLHLIKHTVQAGARSGIPVSLCGELAGCAQAVPLLIGLGLRELSVTPSAIPEIKRTVRTMSARKAAMLAANALKAEGPDQVEQLIAEFAAKMSTRKEES